MADFNVEEYKQQLPNLSFNEARDCFPIPDIDDVPRYVFISYSHADYQQVFADLAELYAADIPFWYDRGLTCGPKWSDEIRKVITNPHCAGTIFYLSENMFLSDNILLEIRIACGKDQEATMPQEKRKYFAVNLTDNAPSALLKNVARKSFSIESEENPDKVLDKLTILNEAFSDKATYLPHNTSHYVTNLIQQIDRVFGVKPNHNPYSFRDAVFCSGHAVIKFPNDDKYTGEFLDGVFAGYGKMEWSDGEVYEGQWKDGWRHGKGTTIYADGAVYEGDWEEGWRHGQGTMTYDDGVTYTGAWADGNHHGQGTMTWRDGDTYTGEWVNGRLHGQGTYTWSDGATYVGEWVNDKRHGQGTMTESDDTTYVGEWKDDHYQGQGTMTWRDGKTYIGEWKDGNCHGQGTMTWPNGKTYVGEWVDDKPHGQGTYTWPNGKIYVGEWQNGKHHGKGKLVYTGDDVFYEGDWVNGMRHGKGTMQLRSLTAYIGDWAEDVPHGIGIRTLPDGTVQSGRFENGEYVGPID